MVRLLSVRALGSLALAGSAALGGFALLGPEASGVGTSASLPLPTTLADFFQPGTQENTLNVVISQGHICANCHGHYDTAIEPFDNWAGSMMAQSTRDPVFHAALAIANQDASFGGDICLRCHTPAGWLRGQSVPTDGSNLDVNQGDYDGVNCHFCHRMVDPVFDAAANPIEDQAILAALNPSMLPQPDTAQYVVDPDDRRRGPFDLGPNFFWHEWRESPYHRESLQCGTCHDVSNPVFTKQSDGTYALNAVNTPHPTHDKFDKFPVERTFSEWAQSQFAKEAIDMGGKFGGNKQEVASCQDCHMPDTTGGACSPGFSPVIRDDMPLHQFNGGNTWVLRAIDNLYPDWETNLTPAIVDGSIARAHTMLENAAELSAWLSGGQLVVRVENNTGHKLPTGYPEGRRMWLNVQIYDRGNNLLQEYGHYDSASATLTTNDTTVFEAKLGLDAAMAAVTGLPAGESFHFVLNNEVLKDNRIPPRGYGYAAFDSVQAGPVGESFQEEQFWHDSTFALPARTHRVVTTLYYQTTSKEYIEFLRDNNTTNGAGQTAYDQWVMWGKSAPAVMKSVEFVRQNLPCPPAISYGMSGVASNGNKVLLSPVGQSRVSANNFKLRIEGGLPGSNGVIFMGTQSDSTPFMGGTRLVGGVITRVTSFHLTGAGQDQVSIPLNSGQVGSELYFQAWMRDSGLASGVVLSNAVHVDVCE
jgi:hypothetical protein